MCLGFKPGDAGWWSQTKPRNYDDRQSFFLSNPILFTCVKVNSRCDQEVGNKYPKTNFIVS